MTMMSREELVQAAGEFVVRPLKEFTLDEMRRLMTVTQYVTDLCLNEIEIRGALTYDRETASVIVPYQSNYMVQTVLTRCCNVHSSGQLEHVEGAWRSPE
jgi:hypothetical protein